DPNPRAGAFGSFAFLLVRDSRRDLTGSGGAARGWVGAGSAAVYGRPPGASAECLEFVKRGGRAAGGWNGFGAAAGIHALNGNAGGGRECLRGGGNGRRGG